MGKVKILLPVLLLSCIAFIGGCLAVAAAGLGVGTVAYVKGDLESVEAAKLEDVYKATVKALEELELATTRDSKDAMSAAIIARDAQDKKVTIKLSAVEENTTKISIRIGTFGNEAKSRRIYEQIKKNLEN